MKISVTVSGISEETGRRALDKLRQALAERAAEQVRQRVPHERGIRRGDRSRVPSERGKQ